MSLLAISTKIGAGIGALSLVIAQAVSTQHGVPLSVESVAITFSGITGVALIGAVAKTYLASQRLDLQVAHLAEAVERVSVVVDRHEAAFAALHQPPAPRRRKKG